jgi:hypothetical protein
VTASAKPKTLADAQVPHPAADRFRRTESIEVFDFSDGYERRDWCGFF